MAPEMVMPLDDLWVGEMTAHTLRGRPIFLINVGGRIHAYLDECPHMRTPLSAGSLDGAVLTCATHGWVFDTATGRGINPAQTCLTEFAVQIRGNDILVDLEESVTRETQQLLQVKRA